MQKQTQTADAQADCKLNIQTQTEQKVATNTRKRFVEEAQSFPLLCTFKANYSS